MSRASQRRGITPSTFSRVLPDWERWIGRVAGRLALGDQDVAEDLAQIARITLWRTTVHVDSAAVRRQMRRRMLDHRRSRTTRILVA